MSEYWLVISSLTETLRKFISFPFLASVLSNRMSSCWSLKLGRLHSDTTGSSQISIHFPAPFSTLIFRPQALSHYNTSRHSLEINSEPCKHKCVKKTRVQDLQPCAPFVTILFPIMRDSKEMGKI